jgi:predicted Zn-dependent protease
MMLIFVLSTLAVLAISIILSEKQQFLRRDTKASKTPNTPPNVKSNYAKTYKKQLDRYFVDDSFLMGKYMNYFNNKLIEKSLCKKDQSKYSYKKQNNKSIINWPKN